MLCPDLSGLSRRCRTGVDVTAGGAGPLAPAPARDDVLTDGHLVAVILANMRDEKGDPRTVCKMVERWCAQVSRFNRGACVAHPAVWRELCNRVFPNYRQAVFPPMEEVDALTQFVKGTRIKVEPRALPWSGEPDALTWRQWFHTLCVHLYDERERCRALWWRQVEARRAARDKSKKLQATHPPSGEPENIQVARNLAGLRRRRMQANRTLQQELARWRMHDRTADHKEYVGEPDYGDSDPDMSDIPAASSDEGYDTAEERELDLQLGAAGIAPMAG